MIDSSRDHRVPKEHSLVCMFTKTHGRRHAKPIQTFYRERRIRTKVRYGFWNPEVFYLQLTCPWQEPDGLCVSGSLDPVVSVMGAAPRVIAAWTPKVALGWTPYIRTRQFQPFSLGLFGITS
jgi:hypothetical protein